MKHFHRPQGLKLETNLKKKNQKHSNTWRLNNVIEQWMSKSWDQGRNQKVSGNKWKCTHNSPKLTGHSKGSPKREVHSNKGWPKKHRKFSNKWPNTTSTKTTGTTTNKAQRE